MLAGSVGGSGRTWGSSVLRSISKHRASWYFIEPFDTARSTRLYLEQTYLARIEDKTVIRDSGLSLLWDICRIENPVIDLEWFGYLLLCTRYPNHVIAIGANRRSCLGSPGSQPFPSKHITSLEGQPRPPKAERTLVMFKMLGFMMIHVFMCAYLFDLISLQTFYVGWSPSTTT